MTMAQATVEAEKALDEQFGVDGHIPHKSAKEEQFFSIKDAIPYVTGENNCPVCGELWDVKTHPLLFFLDGRHHDNVLDVLKFQIGVANRVEAMAARLANSGGENLFHEKDAVQLLVDNYAKGPSAVGYVVSVLGYYATHIREYEATKRGVKIFTGDMLTHFGGLAEFFQSRKRAAEELWPGNVQEKMASMWGALAAIELASIRSQILHMETLMAGEQEKVKELVHQDPMAIWAALAKGASGTATSPPPPQPQQGQPGVR